MQRPPPRPWSKQSKRLVAALGLSCAGLYGYTVYFFTRPAPSTNLNPSSFSPFTLIGRERISDTNSILTLRGKGPARARDGDAIRALWRQGVWSIEVKQPQLMIARRYTPLPTLSYSREEDTARAYGDQKEDIALLVRREAQGEVSRYLHGVAIGAPLEIRGGYLEYKLPEDVKEVVFLAGGTGIAPALQIARVLRERGTDARMSVLWANRRRDECAGGSDTEDDKSKGAGWFGMGSAKKGTQSSDKPVKKNEIVKQIDALVAESKSEEAKWSSLEFGARYFVDEEGTSIRQGDLRTALTVDKSRAGKAGRRLVIISGPDGFVEHLAGSKRLVNGIETQGPLGGLLSKADTRGWEVWKL